MNTEDIKKLLKYIGFLPVEGKTATYKKIYPNQNNYTISIDCDKEKIDYGQSIQIDRNTTSNFAQAENFVVLECVNRLLEKGYEPETLTLEKKYPLGHKNKGNLDILVTKNEQAFLMIECKTWGTEFKKEEKRMLKDGGQLFSYFQQDQATQYLCLYASTLTPKDGIEYTNSIVKVESKFRGLSKEQAFIEWDRTLKDNGIFSSWATPYDVEIKALTRGRLRALQEDDSGYIFNRFAEILRHNVVSDKPNAFNKIFNLFLCKIVDEEKQEDQELEFQWKTGKDNHVELLKRLNDLYKRGMREYLEKGITDFSDKQLNQQLDLFDNEDAKDAIRQMFTKMRLHKNNEFAFKEVFNDASFSENAKVVREVVELLQSYQIRYSHKQQFLSNFFELLLTTGLKQEAGQFFTPVPIAKFIVKCLPLKEMIEDKINKEQVNNFLPTVMDYACGSGHFLTEAMDEIQEIIQQLFENENTYSRTIQKKLKAFVSSPYDWAENYVFGIEKDYRLVKTAKVSCFLNGDGEAKIIHADGLAPFSDYKNIPKANNPNDKENPVFDVLIANPPYSVSAFKKTLKNGKTSFDLYPRLTEESKEIECLFIERTKQLMKPSGFVGIVLPSSILSNTGIYTASREIILKYFDIKAIVEFGSNTFMATGTNTVTLFLQRRENSHWKSIEAQIKRFTQQPQNTTCNGIENAFGKYVAEVWEGITFEDYVSLFAQKPSEALQKHELFTDYNKAFRKTSEVKNYLKKRETKAQPKEQTERFLFAKLLQHIQATETEKLLYFMLALPQLTLLIKAGEKQTEKDFLGYEFSNRRGHEGIKLYKEDDGTHATKLFNDANTQDPEKVNAHIYQAFLDNYTQETPEALKQHLHQLPLINLLDFERTQFEKTVSLSVKKKVNWQLVWNTEELEFLGNVATIRKGTSITKAKIKEGNIPVIAGGKKPAYFHNESNREGNVITVSASGANAGYVGFHKTEIFASDCSTIEAIEETSKPEYLFACLKAIQKEIYNLQRGQAQPHVYPKDLEKIKIPLPSLNIQENIVAEIAQLETQEQTWLNEVEVLENKIKQMLESLTNSANNAIKLNDSDIFEVKIGKRVLKSEIKEKGELPVYSANVFEPFGFIDKELLSNFNLPSVIWGIDGDWMVNVIQANLPFYPTDHCGYLRILKPIFKAKYLAYELHKAGLQLEFSRNKRASIDRIKGIKIPLPPLPEQEKIVAEIESIETKITALQNQLNNLPNEKEAVLKRWLV